MISEAFNLMEADLHNLYPAISFINGARSNHPFDMIEGEEHMFDSCDFERVNDLVEPRPAARGNIACAYFYMHKDLRPTGAQRHEAALAPMA